MKEKWPSFPRRGNLGNLGFLEMMDFQGREVNTSCFNLIKSVAISTVHSSKYVY
jgi:hypothetical protein